MYLWSLSLYGLSLLLLPYKNKQKYVRTHKQQTVHHTTLSIDQKPTCEIPQQQQSLPQQAEMLPHPSPTQPAEEVDSGSVENVLQDRKCKRRQLLCVTLRRSLTF